MKPASLDGLVVKPDPLSSLAARLPDPQDREWYAGLVAYIHSLPPEDELVKVAQLFGFLTLLGRELPEAIASEQAKLREFLRKAYAALEQEVKTNASYHEKLNERLRKLPEEIVEGVKPELIAKAMSESFRQQLAQTGLQDTGQLLKSAVKELQQVSVELDRAVKPLQDRYNSIGSQIEKEVGRLDSASRQLQQQTANLIAQTHEDRWAWKIAVCGFLVAAGMLLGALWEKRDTASLILELQTQVDQLQQTIKALPAMMNSSAPKHQKKGG